MHHDISVSKEYIDTVCDWLDEWAEREDSWTVPQFLKEYGIGWTYFNALMEICPQLHLQFETIIAGLHSKWMRYAFEQNELPPHMQKILLKYLRVYDNHAFYVDQEAKKEIAEKTKFAVTNYAAENYSEERLEGLYKRLFDDNVNKRRSRKKAE